MNFASTQHASASICLLEGDTRVTAQVLKE